MYDALNFQVAYVFGIQAHYYMPNAKQDKAHEIVVKDFWPSACHKEKKGQNTAIAPFCPVKLDLVSQQALYPGNFINYFSGSGEGGPSPCKHTLDQDR